MKVKSLFVSMFAIAALASCSQDDQPNLGGEGNVVAGQKTYATFTFNVDGGTKTRANMTPEGGNDADIADLRLLIFDGEGTSAKLLINDVVTTTAGKTKTVETTSGVKRIFVLANSAKATSDAIGTKLDALVVNTTTLANFYNLMSNPVASQTSVADMGTEFTEMTVNGKILMSNVADASSKQTLVANVSATESENAPAGTVGKNHFSFKVKRAIAKGNLAVAKAATEDGFTLSDITYGVRNVNRSVNYVQQFENHNVLENDLDVTHTAAAIRPWAPYYNVFDGKTADDLAKSTTYAPYYYGGFTIATSGNETAQTAPTLPTTRTASVYFTENSNNQQLKGSSTYFGIAASVGDIDKGKIAATFKVNEFTGSITTTSEATGYTAGGAFYMIRKLPVGVTFAAGNERSIFTTEATAWQAIYDVLIQGGLIKKGDYADADALKAGATADKMVTATAGGTFNLNEYFGEYKGGKCYYRLDIHEKENNIKRHLVRRNHNYVATVNTFATIGEPTEGDLDNNPETPVDAEKTYVTATITVAPWHNVDMDGDL